MTPGEYFRSRLITYGEALGKIGSGDVIAMAAYGNEPRGLLRRLHTVFDSGVENLTVWLGNPTEDYPFVSAPGLDGKLEILSIFFGENLRTHMPEGRISFVPNNLHSCFRVMMNCRAPNVFLAAVSPLDRYGYVSMSLSQQTELELLDTAELVIFEVNPGIPRTMGTVRIPAEKADYFIQADYPISTAPEYPLTEQQLAIADAAAELIKDGDTIQLGIGGMPDAVAMRLTGRSDLGIYTEMIGTAMGKLMECGAVNNSRKKFFRGRTIGAFCWGSMELYEYIDGNPMVELLPCSYVNDPFNIAKNENFVSVNGALQIDLTGQICSESIGARQYSGTGGAWDFACGAYHARGGRGVIALPTTAKKGSVSRIVPALDRGAIVSIPRNIADYIVTEYGAVRLRDCSVRERAERLISVAHPDYRAELRREARKALLL